jgi:hypothetical protein
MRIKSRVSIRAHKLTVPTGGSEVAWPVAGRVPVVTARPCVVRAWREQLGDQAQALDRRQLPA